MSKRFITLAALSAVLAPQAGAVVKTSILPVRAPIGTVAVVGAGQVDVIPNIARVTLSFTDQKLVLPAPLAEVAPEVRAQNLVDLKEAHAARIAPVLEEVQGIVSEKKQVRDRDIRSDQSSQPEIEYATKKEGEDGEEVTTNQKLFKGHTITTTIQVTLRGTKKSVEGRLSRLFDSVKVQPDSQSQPVYEVAPRRQSAAERTALGRAFADAEGKAKAQLKPYERLGHAIQRGESQVPAPVSPYGGGSRKAASRSYAETADASGGSGIARIGSKTVEAETHVVFEVLPNFTPRPPFPPRPPIRPLRRAAARGK